MEPSREEEKQVCLFEVLQEEMEVMGDQLFFKRTKMKILYKHIDTNVISKLYQEHRESPRINTVLMLRT